MTEKDIRIMSAPPEQWEAAKHYESTNAYTETHRKPMYPCEDFINLSGTTAEKLYRSGLACQPIHPKEAALPIFNVEIMNLGEGFSEHLDDILFPAYNLASDRELSIYGVSLLFSSDSSHVACDIAYHYSDHSGGGFEEVGTIAIMADGDYFFTFPHGMSVFAHEDFGLYDYTSITAFCNWLGYFWRGIQNQFINRPEHIRFSHHRNKNANADADVYHDNNAPKMRVAKVQRVITIFLDEEDDLEISAANRHEITLSLWSVAGHWRVTKSGKRVWIAPYYKGKDRNKQNAAFGAKEYRFDEEVCNNA